MDRKKVIGIGLVVISLVIVAVGIISGNNDRKMAAKADIETIVTTSNTKHQEMNIDSESITEIETTAEETEMNTEKITVSDEKEVELIEKIKIKDVNDEVLEILECDKDTLYKLIQTFANGYGYSNTKFTSYAGTCTINHIHNTKTATFYFYTKSKKTIYFDVVLDRKTKKLVCELQ